MFKRYFTERKWYTCAALAALVLLLAGCGGGKNSSASVTNSLSSNSGAASPTASAATSAVVTLKHQPTGTANLSWDHTTRKLTVQVKLTGLAPNSIHPVHIDQGNCADNDGGHDRTLYPLMNAVADAHGVATLTSTVNAPNGIPAKNWYLDVHNGPGMSTSDQSLSIVCGDIVNHDTSLRSTQSAQVVLQSPAGDKSQHVSGNATLTLTGHTLTVQLTLTGLEPKSQHMVHIHSGSCASQGAVIYPLTLVKADALGNSTTTTTIQNVSAIPASGWYINVHYGTDLSTQTGFDPISCGDVTVSK